jgi:hypothetical protein
LGGRPPAPPPPRRRALGALDARIGAEHARAGRAQSLRERESDLAEALDRDRRAGDLPAADRGERGADPPLGTFGGGFAGFPHPPPSEVREVTRAARQRARVRVGEADVGTGLVGAAERFDLATELLHRRRTIAQFVGEHDGLGAAALHAGEHALVGHRARQAQRVGDRLALGTIGPHADAAVGGSALEVVQRDPRAQPARAVLDGQQPAVAALGHEVVDRHDEEARAEDRRPARVLY